jgi:hypothetical protein
MFPYISWDPGVTTGVVCWDLEGEPVRKAQLNINGLNLFLRNFEQHLRKNPEDKPVEWIIEDYRVFNHKASAHAGSRLETARISGNLEGVAARAGIEIVFQPANILNITQMWSGVRMPSDHSKSHQVSAYLHGYYRLHKKGIIKARVLEELNDG